MKNEVTKNKPVLWIDKNSTLEGDTARFYVDTHHDSTLEGDTAGFQVVDDSMIVHEDEDRAGHDEDTVIRLGDNDVNVVTHGTRAAAEILISMPSHVINNLYSFREYFEFLLEKGHISKRTVLLAGRLSDKIAEGITDLDDLIESLCFHINADMTYAAIRVNDEKNFTETRLKISYRINPADWQRHVGAANGILEACLKRDSL